MSLHKKGFWLSVTGLATLLATPAQADVFNIPRFVEPGSVGLGLEPVLTLSPDAGFGFNARYTQGLTDLMNFQAILGTGGGPRRFRFGGNLVFDVVPDIEGQPGIGIATQAIYYRVPDAGRLEVTAIPYIHKTFPQAHHQAIDPFFSFPIGFAFSGGHYEVMETAVVGSRFRQSDLISYTGEIGVNVNHAYSYFSGGITFYP